MSEPMGAILRRQRVEVLHIGLREMASLLSIAPAHLTDIEKGRRTPSEDLLVRIVTRYKLSEAVLRSGWSRPDAIISTIATESETTADKVPQLLRAARALRPEQWDELIEQAQLLSKNSKVRRTRG